MISFNEYGKKLAGWALLRLKRVSSFEYISFRTQIIENYSGFVRNFGVAKRRLKTYAPFDTILTPIGYMLNNKFPTSFISQEDSEIYFFLKRIARSESNELFLNSD